MASRNPDQPNLLFVLTDDQGAWAMGCAGNAEIRSPNLDRLAREGIRFDNFFCTSPVCSPARASILTGRIPSQHGVHDALMWQSDTSKGGLDREVPADRVQFLLGMPTYAELLRDRGYDTCLSGKWHLGDGLEPRCGFDTWNPMPYGGTNYFNVPVVANGHLDKHETYATELFTDNALRFLNAQAGEQRPFCLAVHYTAPHKPWGREHHPQALWDEYYDRCPFESVPGPDEPLPVGFNAGAVDAETRKQNLSGYFAAIEGMDRNVGRLLDWLEEQNLRNEYGPVRMIRSREWKLVWRYPAGAHELFSVGEDPAERVNLFGQRGQADRIRALRRELDDWFASYVDSELDGSRLPVTGRGQLDHATREDAFAYRFPWND